MNVCRGDRNMLHKTFAQMREVAVRVSLRRHALVHLINMHAGPWEVFIRQCAEHDPGSAATAHGESKSAARGDGGTGIRGDGRRARFGYGIIVIKNFELHGLSQPASGARKSS